MFTKKFYRLAITIMYILILGAFSFLAFHKENAPVEYEDSFTEYYSLSEEERRPEKFERYLWKNPEDESRRYAALAWYNWKESITKSRENLPYTKNVDRLKYHVTKMIEYHPSNWYISSSITSELYMDRQYGLEVIAHLEKHLEEGNQEHGVYGNLAAICKRLALPPVGDDPEQRKKFLHWFSLPEDTVILDEIDMQIADKAVNYYHSALDATGVDQYHTGSYSEDLAEILMKLNRIDEALTVCKDALPHLEEIVKPGFLVMYGKGLRNAGKIDEAKEILRQVRTSDKEGFEQGPGCSTIEAETLLGSIALDDGNLIAANKYLLLSVDVQKCCHNTTRGFSLSLARKLLNAGENDTVEKFCRIIDKEFTPGREDVENLLNQTLKVENQLNQTPNEPVEKPDVK